MTPLRQHLHRLREPVEVDAIDAVVSRAERAVTVQAESIHDRIRHAVEELEAERKELVALHVQAHNLNERTGEGKGFMAALRTTLANDAIEDSRDRAAFDLQGTCAQLARSIERAVAMAEDVDLLLADIDYAADALGDLATRAVRGGLTAEAERIRATVRRLRGLAPSLQDAADPIAAPVRRARKTLDEALKTTAVLRSTERASTFGEAALDSVLIRGSGPVSDRLRQAVGEAAPTVVPDLDRDAMDHADAEAELARTVDGARRRARTDEELRRAAEAELDALEWD